MAIATAATEAKATALLTECRRCLAIGCDLKATYIRDVIDQLESATVNDLSGRTNVTPYHKSDGRNDTESAVVDA
jgi:hypothetical protein